MKAHSGLLSTAAEIQDLAKALQGHDHIAFDTEFIRESTFYPVVEILQIATDEKSWLVDARAFKKNFNHGPKGGYDQGIEPLLDVLRDPSILKIVHAAQGDQECLFTAYTMLAKPTLDTAVAASLLGYGEGVGLGKLLKSVLDIDIKKGHARTNWSVRPLPEQLIEYAHADVIHLVELGKTLLEKLEKQGRRAWGLELSSKWEDPALYDLAPEDIAQKLAKSGRVDKRGYSALIELVRWREERVKAVNVPRRWIADDTVLMDLAHVRPKDMEHLAQFRGLNKGELKSSGEAILTALKRASDAEDLILPKTPKTPIPTPEEMQVLDLLKCYVGILADRHHLTDRHLITSAQYLPLIRSRANSAKELVSSGILTTAAAELAGEELLAMVQGRRALSVNGAQIKIVEIAEAKK